MHIADRSTRDFVTEYIAIEIAIIMLSAGNREFPIFYDDMQSCPAVDSGVGLSGCR